MRPKHLEREVFETVREIKLANDKKSVRLRSMEQWMRQGRSERLMPANITMSRSFKI